MPYKFNPFTGTLDWTDPATGGGGIATVQEEGSSLTQRLTLNFKGDTVTAADDAANSRTNVTVASFGSGAGTIAQGNDSRFSDSRAPSGSAGGDLAGTYPNPTIGTGKVTSTNILDGTVTDTDVAAANKDGAAGTASMRTLGTGSTQAAAGNHTHVEGDVTNLVNDLALANGGGALVPTGITFQNFARYNVIAVTGAVLTSGTLKLCAIWLPTGFTVTSITFASGTTALTTAGTGPHAWAALFDSSRNLLRQSTDDTAATWAASSLKTFTLSSTFQTTYTGLHYLGLGLNAGSTGTMPTVVSGQFAAATLMTFPPILNGNSTTGITGTAPSTAAAISPVGTNVPYCGVA